MAELPDLQKLELKDQCYHIRFNGPDRFDQIKTPDGAANVAESVSSGSEVRMGREKAEDEWEVEAVLITKKRETGTQKGKKLLKK